jgi:hypothetical protein
LLDPERIATTPYLAARSTGRKMAGFVNRRLPNSPEQKEELKK